MADLQTTFDPNSVEPGQGSLEPVPAGEYIAQITESDVTPAKSGNGMVLALTWEILEGDYEKRKAWDRINYQHSSAQAQLIGQQRLKAICEAVGHAGHLTKSDDLHFRPCRLRLAIEEDKTGQYLSKNIVKAVRSLQATPPAGKSVPEASPTPQPQMQAAKAAQTAQRSARPWSK